MGILRAEIIAKIRKGIREGIPRTRLYWELRAVGPVTRKTTFLADYRSIANIERVEGALRYIRKDRYPTERVIAAVGWNISKEFMYKVKVQSVIRLGEPITERFINIMSDVPMTPGMIEAEVEEQWEQWERYAPELITGLQVWSAVRKVME